MGTYSDQPDPPTYFQAIQTSDVVRYTDVAQQQWFLDRIRYAYGSTNANARIDPDGTTIRWFSSYVLPLGYWLYKGNTPVSDADLHAGLLRPITETFPTSGGV